MAPTLGLRAYAAYRKERGLPGTTHTAVGRAIHDGRIRDGARRVDGNWVIDPDVADAEWSEHTQPTKQREGPRGGRPRAPDRSGQGALFEAPLELAGTDAPESLRMAAQVEQFYKARLRQLEYRERIGELVLKAGVAKELARSARVLRDSLMAIPERLAGELARLGDEVAIRTRMLEELTAALEEFTGAADL